MNDALRIGKKSFTWFVVGATILWAMSAVLLVAPLAAGAATLAAGDLIRGTEKSVYGGYPVYYYGSDSKKYLFPTESTYKTWFADFTAVKVVTQAELEAIAFGGNVTFKPGVKMVKFPGDAKAYAVTKGGVLRHVSSEAVAVALYGAEWFKPANLVSLPEGFQANYSMTGATIVAAADYDKVAVAAASSNIGTDKGLTATPAVVVSATASAALASDSPAGSVLPTSATGVTVMKFNLTAGSAAATVTGLTFKSTGVGASADFANIYVYDGATRLTSGKTLVSQTKQVEYVNVGLNIAANSTKALSLVVDVAATPTAVSGDTHAFSLISATGATVSGMPVAASTMSIGSQAVSTVTVQRGSDPANPTIGQKNVPVAEFKLTAGSNDTEFKAVTVTVGGTVSISDLSNFELYQGSTKLATGTVVSDRVTFKLDSAYALNQGNTRVFTIKADVAGRGARTIAVYIDSTYPSDLSVTDKVYGFGAGQTWTSFAVVATAAATPATGGSFVTTQGGKVTMAFNGPSASDVSKGSQDVVLYKLSMTAGDQAVEVKKMGVVIAGTAGGFVHGSTTTHYFTDIKIKNVDTGATVMGPKEHTAAASATTTGATPCASSGTLCYTDAWTLDAGKTVNLAVTADLANAEDAGADEFFDEGYAVTLEAIQSTGLREISTGQYLTPSTDVVGGNIAQTGNTMTVRSSALTVNYASTPVAGSTVKGSQGVQMIGFAFTAGSSSAVKVTQVVLAGEGNDTSFAFGGATDNATVDDLIISATLWDGTAQVGLAKSPSSTGTLTFDNLSWNLNAGETKKLVVKANVATTLIAGTVDYVYLGVSSVTSQDADSNSITATVNANATNTDAVSGNYLSINSAGTLTVDIDGDTPLGNLVMSGASDVAFTKVKFTAGKESFLVNKLRVVNTSGGASADSSTADDMLSSIKLSYKKQDGTTGTATGSLVTGVADFSGLGFYVGVDKTEVLTISATIGDMNAATGRAAVETPRLGLDFGNAATSTNFEAVGVGSSTSLTTETGVTDGGTGYTVDADSQDAEVVGNSMYVVKSKPTVTLAAASPSGAAVPGLNEVLRFTVAADAAGDIVLDVVSFKITTTDNATSLWNVNGDSTGNIDLTSAYTLYDASDLTTALEAGDSDWALYGSAASDGTLSGTETVGYVRLALTTPKTIAAGTSKTFVLKVDTTGASSSTDDTVRFDVLEEAGSVNTTLAALTEFQWDETGSNAVVDNTGTLVKNLPVNGGTLVY